MNDATHLPTAHMPAIQPVKFTTIQTVPHEQIDLLNEEISSGTTVVVVETDKQIHIVSRLIKLPSGYYECAIQGQSYRIITPDLKQCDSRNFQNSFVL